MTDYNQDEVLMKMFKKLFGFIVFCKNTSRFSKLFKYHEYQDFFFGIGRQYFSNKANKVNKKSH